MSALLLENNNCFSHNMYVSVYSSCYAHQFVYNENKIIPAVSKDWMIFRHPEGIKVSWESLKCLSCVLFVKPQLKGVNLSLIAS